jgi:hypothetical protein
MAVSTGKMSASSSAEAPRRLRRLPDGRGVRELKPGDSLKGLRITSPSRERWHQSRAAVAKLLEHLNHQKYRRTQNRNE